MTKSALPLERSRVATVRQALAEPHVVLGAGAAVILACEYGYQTSTSDAWIVAQAAVSAAALAVAWRAHERLRLGPLLALALAFHVGWIALHLGLSVEGDFDSRSLYRRQGDALLHGNYPRSEYPVGAVLLFALESWVSGGATRTANALLMIPFQLVCVASVWALRTRWSGWFAALIAFWPLNAFSWEFKFDLVPAALLAAGLLLALRGRWSPAGAVLGVGVVVKWSPGLAAAALAIWLVASGLPRAAARLVLAFAATALVFYLPFLVWSPSEVLAAYSRQGGRSITAESLWYLPLHALGLAHVRSHISFGAGAPEWADTLATAAQVALVLAVLVLAALLRGRLWPAVAAAALAPAVFLLTNRIFSPQFFVVLFVAWAAASALAVRGAREQLALGLAFMGASLANAFIYPFALPDYVRTWQLCSLVLFVLALAATAWLLARAALASPREAGAMIGRDARDPPVGSVSAHS